MVSEHKRQYMKIYNKKPHVKAKKALYMRQKRAEIDRLAAQNLVKMLLELGYENLAFEYALERAPEMLATIKTPIRKKSRVN
ncbi:MAG: hypothetical protein QW063_02305 [Candidatus Nanoarchaeia archaeon]